MVFRLFTPPQKAKSVYAMGPYRSSSLPFLSLSSILALAYYAFMLFAWGVFIQDEGETKNHKTMRDYAFMLFAWGVFIQYQGETKNHKTMRDYASMLFTLGVFI